MKSIPQSATGISTPAKLDMASTMYTFPKALATFPTDSISFRMPEVVSLCTMDTWVISGSSARIFSTVSASGTRS